MCMVVYQHCTRIKHFDSCYNITSSLIAAVPEYAIQTDTSTPSTSTPVVTGLPKFYQCLNILTVWASLAIVTTLDILSMFRNGHSGLSSGRGHDADAPGTSLGFPRRTTV